jgi:acetoin utilization protein AcuB
MRLQEIMSKEVLTVPPTESADDAWERLWRAKIHHLVVMDGGRVVGILSDRDLGGARGAPVRRGCCVGDLMNASVVAATPTTTLRQAANLMRGRSIGSLPVVDKGRLQGIVTVSDLLAQLGRGSERPARRGSRWILRDRGPRRPAQRRAAQ